MNRERVQTTLHFMGEWPWWAGCACALVLGAAAWLLYRRDRLPARWWVRAVLPTLRALAVMMMVLMLSGPVLHHRKTVGQLSRLLLFVDGSQSMSLTDPGMDLGRKVLILTRLGMLSREAVPMDLPQAGEALAEAQAAAEKVRQIPGIDAAQWSALVNEFASKAAQSSAALAKAHPEPERLAAFAKDLIGPAQDLTKRKITAIDDRTRAVQDLGKLSELAGRWQREIEELFQKKLGEQVSGEGSALQVALRKFDALPRWQRLQAALCEGDAESLLGKFAAGYEVELFSLEGSHATRLWQPNARGDGWPATLPKPAGATSDLVTGIKASTGADAQGQRGAIVIFSDGQHNEGESPVELAKVMGGRGMPVFTVGVGSQLRPRDIALIKTEAPDAVFYRDRIRGQIVFKDDLPVGQPFTVSIQDGTKVVWEQKLFSENKPLRRVPFDFPVTGLVEERLAQAKAARVEVSGLPMELKVSISNAEGDTQPGNNVSALRFRAVTQKRKVLLLDGRPRWETRYLRNLFERDEQWEISTVVVGMSAGEPGLLRGEKLDAFPADAARLATYDLILFGEVPRSVWKGDELQWIRDFVGKRGGALVFIDGARGRFAEYADTPLAPVFPVTWSGKGSSEEISRLLVTERGAALAPFTLASDPAQNAALWSGFQTPHWLAEVQALPGAETLLEAERKGQRFPAVVARPFGAGQVLYHGFDDSWRWRYEVADQYHVRYWNQAANWIAELPFAVRDKLVSLDAGAITYQPGDSAEVRVRLRDGEGKPVSDATVDGVLYRDGQRVATLRLAADENGGALYRGHTSALDPGDYEVAVESAALDGRNQAARTQFKVQARETGEMTMLNLNEDLLRQVAAASGGQYLREEHSNQLTDLLAPLSQGKVQETETVLAESYWWFLPLIGLLTAEWIIRKRVGML